MESASQNTPNSIILGSRKHAQQRQSIHSGRGSFSRASAYPSGSAVPSHSCCQPGAGPKRNVSGESRGGNGDDRGYSSSASSSSSSSDSLKLGTSEVNSTCVITATAAAQDLDPKQLSGYRDNEQHVITNEQNQTSLSGVQKKNISFQGSTHSSSHITGGVAGVPLPSDTGDNAEQHSREPTGLAHLPRPVPAQPIATSGSITSQNASTRKREAYEAWMQDMVNKKKEAKRAKLDGQT